MLVLVLVRLRVGRVLRRMVTKAENYEFAFYFMVFVCLCLIVIIFLQSVYIDNLSGCAALCDLRGPLG